MNYNDELRKRDFRNIIVHVPLIQVYQTQPFTEEEPNSFGVQWWSGIDRPPSLHTRPDQNYWKTNHIIFMLGRKRWALVFRGKSMPYRNFDEWLSWRRKRFNREN